MIKLKWVEIVDMAVRGKRRLDLTKIPDGSTVALAGVNGSGKSTMLECSLPGAMFGFLPSREPSGNEARGGKLADVALSRKATLTACYEIDGPEYTFHHMLDGEKGTWEPWIYRDGKALELGGLTSNGKVKVFKAQVDQLLGGASWDLLSASVFWPQGGGGSFAYLKESEARALFARMIGAEKYTPLAGIARDRLRVAKASMVEREAQEAKVTEAADLVRETGQLERSEADLVKTIETLEGEAAKAREVLVMRETAADLTRRLAVIREAIEQEAAAAKHTEDQEAESEVERALEAELEAARAAADVTGATERLARRTELEAEAEVLEAKLAVAKEAYEEARLKAVAARTATVEAEAAMATWHERYRQHSDQNRRRAHLDAEVSRLQARLSEIGDVTAPATDAISSRLTMCNTEAAGAAARAGNAAERKHHSTVDLDRACSMAGRLKATSCLGRQAPDPETGKLYSACVLIQDAVSAAAAEPSIREDIAKHEVDEAAAQAAHARWTALAAKASDDLAAARATAALADEAGRARDALAAALEELGRLGADSPGERPDPAPDAAPAEAAASRAATVSDGLAGQLAAVRRELARIPSAEDLRATLAGEATGDTRTVDVVIADLRASRSRRADARDAAATAASRAKALLKDEDTEPGLAALEDTVAGALSDLQELIPDDAGSQLADITDKIDTARQERQEIREKAAGTSARARALLDAAGVQEGAEAAASRLSAEVADLRADVAELTRVYRALGPKGIPAMLIERAGPWIGEHATDLMEDVTGERRFDMRVLTREEKAKGDGLKDAFKILVQDNTKTAADGQPLERQLLNFSGGEKSILDSALRASIAAYMRDLGGLDWRTVSSDEMAGALDEARGPEWVALCKAAVERFGLAHQVLVSHSPDVRAACDYVIDVQSL